MVRWLKPFITLCTLCAVFLAGVWFGQGRSAVAQNAERFPLLDEAADYVEQYFVKDRPEDTALQYGMVRAYLSQLGDPNTFFIEPAVAASESDVLAGRYGGIGVEVRRNELGQFVLYPFVEGSAQRVGLREGDILLTINGAPLAETATLDEVRQALRGEIVEGAGVTVQVRNQAEPEDAAREYFVPFEEVLIPSVTWRVLFEAPDLGYIAISRFTNRTPDEFRTAVADLKGQKVRGIVLDLRNNPGGLLQESLIVAGEFFDGGVLSTERRVSGNTEKIDEGGGVLVDLPVVVLVNHGTASAAEIVAGAIQARERGLLIGQKTFGKGSIQSIFALSDASSIHVTVALWYTPDGAALDGVGLTPDIEMIPDSNGRDVELGEAIRHLSR